ncbi:GNAT family N-acetyltransferase [Roseofilum casamattae]|uniref:GNAT family N-acetyltransferase n=1 Tax=Roseofilum casamattae BLCC-M143 TaxID=3022442 RepID=A0ABT7BXS1_9CYAN|nr:GNAT family N-acetyltransferase [Roseofilum casamattae]MDJ1183860.1 GNAT family N-acetyltransferase [Roseofilum casamattae BLCC-M143]
MVQNQLIPGYRIRVGWAIERDRLVKFMHQTYAELFPGQDFSHLNQAIDLHFSQTTPLWWVEKAEDPEISDFLSSTPRAEPVGCLWMGRAVDQINGAQHSHIFLLYIIPEHRRQGLGSALMERAETYAKQAGEQQMSLQVFCDNQPAIALYDKLGFQSLSTWMVKRLS